MSEDFVGMSVEQILATKPEGLVIRRLIACLAATEWEDGGLLLETYEGRFVAVDCDSGSCSTCSYGQGKINGWDRSYGTEAEARYRASGWLE